MTTTDSVALIYLSTDAILSFMTEHPIDWSDKELAKRGGIGDSAGLSPTPAVREFLALLRQHHGLFTQEVFAQHCAHVWDAWWKTLSRHQQSGVRAKLYRNFYPSLIDSLHVWSMFVEAQWFDRCILDSCDDATGKTDITVTNKMITHHIALLGPTKQALRDREYKLNIRHPGLLAHTIAIQLPPSRDVGPGNKRWFNLTDFQSLGACQRVQNNDRIDALQESINTLGQEFVRLRHDQMQIFRFIYNSLNQMSANIRPSQRKAQKALTENLSLWTHLEDTSHDPERPALS
jgi:hypothetical protein